MERRVLVDETGPNGNVTAVVEDDGRTVYLYLRGPEDVWLKFVWVQNRIEAPAEVDAKGRAENLAPLMPRPHCRQPMGAAALHPEELRLVWLPEGNGVALYDPEGLLAAIVPWSGLGEFYGYSRQAVGQGPFAWQLDGADALRARFRAAEAYWADWERSPSPWQRLQAAQLAAYERAFGKPLRYFAIGGARWPPRGLIRISRPDGIVLASIGMALRPQPQVELHDEHPEALRRIELGVSLPETTSESIIQDWSSFLAGQVDLPWARYTWLGPGHTIPCGAAASRGFPAVMLTPGESLGLPAPLPEFEGDPVTLLWMTPLTADEWASAKRDGSSSVVRSLVAARRSRA